VVNYRPLPQLKRYDVFISHAWEYDYEYHRLESLLDGAANFSWRNFSVPSHDPLLNPARSSSFQELAGALAAQIRPVHCVLILSGMYCAHRQWIQAEIQIAASYQKPIIGVVPNGSQRIPRPREVRHSAIDLVGWRTDSVVSAIRRYSL